MGTVVAQSYGEALFSLAKEDGKLDMFKSQLLLIQETMKENPKLMQVLSFPKIEKEEKKQLLTTVYGRSVDPMILNLLKLLIDKSRFAHTADIISAFMVLYNKENGIEIAYVTSAKALNEEELKRLQKMLEDKLKKHVEIKVSVDEELLAGIRIKIGDNVLDNTAKSRLERLKEAVVRNDITTEVR